MFSKFLEFFRPEKPTSLPRRSFLLSLGLGISAGAGLRQASAGLDNAPEYLRPPGALDEKEFVNRCIRCDACFHACPTQTLLPSGFDKNIVAYGTPVLDTRHGGCAYECNACGEACPTGAIQALPLETKKQLKMGVAEISKTRCMPWAAGSPCTLCFTACPYDAIHWVSTGKPLPWGGFLEAPVVDAAKCTGCGRCETVCPVSGTAAIVVAPEYPRQPLQQWPVKPRGRGIAVRDIS